MGLTQSPSPSGETFVRLGKGTGGTRNFNGGGVVPPVLDHVADANGRYSLTGKSPGYQVIQDTDPINGDGTTYTLQSPSSALTAAAIDSTAPDAMGVYTKRGTSGGKDYYNLIGAPDDTIRSAITWGALGGILGTGWGVRANDAALLYYTTSNTTYPWQAASWIAVLGSGDVSGHIASVTQGEVDAGVTLDGDVDAGAYTSIGRVGQDFGFNEYAPVSGSLSYNIWHASGEWQGRKQISNDGVFKGFPWLIMTLTGDYTGATFTRNDIASNANWTH